MADLRALGLLTREEEKRLNKWNTNFELGSILRRIAAAVGDADLKRTPLAKMADFGYDQMGEEAGYILSELKAAISSLERLIDTKASSEDLIKSLNSIINRLENKASNEDVTSLLKSCEKMFALKSDIDNTETSNLAREAINSLKLSVSQLEREQDKHRNEEKIIEISGERLLTLNSSPLEVFPKPGAGYAIEIHRIELFLDHEGADYTIGGDDDISMYYPIAGEIVQIESTGFLDQSSDQRRVYYHPSNILSTDESLFLTVLNSDITASVINEITDVTFSQSGSFYDVDGEAKYISFWVKEEKKNFWFNVTDGVNTQIAPDIDGTNFNIDVLSTDTSANIATKFRDGLCVGITAPAPGANIVTVTHTAATSQQSAESVDAAAISITAQGVGSPKLKIKFDYRVTSVIK